MVRVNASGEIKLDQGR